MTKKVFKVKIDEKEIELYFKHPTQEEIFKLDLVYRVAFANAIRQGAMSEAEAKKAFKENDSWTPEDDNKVTMITIQIAQLEVIIKSFLDGNKQDKSEKEIDGLVQELMNLRNEHLGLIGTRTSLFNNTAEGAANEQRMHKFVELCCYRAEDDEKFFDSYEQYVQFLTEQYNAESEIYKQAYIFEYGLPDDISAGWAEVEWLKQYSNRKIEQPVEMPKKKRGRKPKQQ